MCAGAGQAAVLPGGGWGPHRRRGGRRWGLLLVLVVKLPCRCWRVLFTNQLPRNLHTVSRLHTGTQQDPLDGPGDLQGEWVLQSCTTSSMPSYGGSTPCWSSSTRAWCWSSSATTSCPATTGRLPSSPAMPSRGGPVRTHGRACARGLGPGTLHSWQQQHPAELTGTACRSGIDLVLNSRVCAVEHGSLTVEGPDKKRRKLAFGACLWATGGRPAGGQARMWLSCSSHAIETTQFGRAASGCLSAPASA